MAGKKAQGKRRKGERPFDEVDLRILMLLLTEPGISQQAIAERIKYNESTVNVRINRPEFQARLDKATDAMTVEAVKIIKRAQLKAAVKATQLIDSIDQQIAARVSLKLLDGIPEVAAGTLKPEGDSPGKNMTDDERKAVARYLAESESEEAPE